MTDETRPFAEMKLTNGYFHLIVADHSVMECQSSQRLSKQAKAINAAHESRCQARERAAAVKALREMYQVVVECGREWQSMGHKPTHAEYLRQIDARADAIERGEVSP